MKGFKLENPIQSGGPMTQLLKDLEVGPNPPEVVYAVIEIPKGGRNRFRYDEDKKVFFLDGVLFSPFHYATDYGRIPKTLYDDGEPLDILVLMEEPTFSGCVIEARPIGLLRMMTDGEYDDKILAVPTKDPRYEGINDIKDVFPHILDEIAHFFKYCEEFEGKEVEIVGWRDSKTAKKAIEHAIKLYRRKG